MYPIITAVTVFPLLTRDFVGLPAVPEASSGPALGKLSSASGWYFSSVVVSLLEQIKLAVFDSGDELELGGCHSAVGVSVGKKYAIRRNQQ